MINKILKEEQERFEKWFAEGLWNKKILKEFIEASKKRAIKAALEASKLDKYKFIPDNADDGSLVHFSNGYITAVQDQHKRIQEITDKI